MLGLIGADVFLLLVNGVYQSIYQLFRREWASQKRSVVCLMFSAWSDRCRGFSSGEWCLSEHLSVVSEGMGFSETICSVSNVPVLGLNRGRFFLLLVNGVLSEHLSVVSEGMGFSERSVVVSNVQCLVWSGRCFSFWWMVSIRASISCFGGNGLLRNDL